MHDMHSAGSNRKLMGGLVLVLGVGLVIAALASGTNLLPFLPYLLILACPLMMIFMMGSMGHQHSLAPSELTVSSAEDQLDMAGLSPDQKARALRRELTRLAWRQEALRQDLERFEAEQNVERVGDSTALHR